MKKTISLILTVVILALSVPVLGIPTYASAEDFTYEINDDGATVTGYTGSASVVNIPDMLGGKEVKKIGFRALYSNSSITEVSMPDTITEIETEAFWRCRNITSIHLSANIISIGNSAFKSLIKLNSIQLSDKLQSIGMCAFCTCEKLTFIDIPDSVTSVGNDCFSYCTGLTDVKIGGGLTALSDSMFSNCTALTSVKIPGTVSSVGENCFAECKNMSSVIINSGVTTIATGAFKGCSLLKTCNIPDSVTSMGEGVFLGCSNIQSVILPRITAIPKNTFTNCTSLIFVSVPSTVTKIGEEAFKNCSSYNELSWLNNNIEIGDYAFCNCSSINKLFLSGPLKIGRYAFNGCNGLKTVVLGDTFQSIGAYAFRDCDQLSYVQIGTVVGKSTVKIDEGAFSYCNSLLGAEIDSNVTTLASGAFAYCPKMTTFIGKGNIYNFGSYIFANSAQLKSFSYTGATPLTSGYFLFASDSVIQQEINPFSEPEIPAEMEFSISMRLYPFVGEYYLCNNWITSNEMPFGLNTIVGAYRAQNPNYLSNDDKKVYDKACGVIQKCGITNATNYGTRIKLIHDWLVNHVAYDKTISKEHIHDAYGALVKNECVCDGYASSFQLLMQMVGVNCLTYGASAPDHSAAHAWNMVELNGSWYFIDVTWDRDNFVRGRSIYEYFMKSCSELYQPHPYSTLNHSKYSNTENYYVYPNSVATSAYNATNICSYNRGALSSVNTTTNIVGATCDSVGYRMQYNAAIGYYFYNSFIMPTEHTGGSATCISRAVCTVCNKPYGGLNYNNHIGGGSANCTSPAICDGCGCACADINPDLHSFVCGECERCHILLGDLNFDGLVNGKDNNLMFQTVNGNIEITYSQVEARETAKTYFYVADINGDGLVNGIDNNLLMRYINGNYSFS